MILRTLWHNICWNIYTDMVLASFDPHDHLSMGDTASMIFMSFKRARNLNNQASLIFTVFNNLPISIFYNFTEQKSTTNLDTYLVI